MTVIVPSYNHAAFVAQAVGSALVQTEQCVEVLVIDDGSEDDSVACLAPLDDPRLTVLTQENRGLSRTLNRGLELARGRWVKFLPSDDLLAPECLARELAVIDSTPGVELVFCLPEVVDAALVPLADPAPQAWFDTAARTRDELLPGLIERNFLSAPGALFRRDRALEAGGFDVSLAIAQDYDLWLRLLPRCDARLLPERLVKVRWHGANQSARVTQASEAERACALVRALCSLRLEDWMRELREPGSAARPDAEVAARLALARLLLRSGLREALPFARDLVREMRERGAELPADDPLFAPLREIAPELAHREPPSGGTTAQDDRRPDRGQGKAVATAAKRPLAGLRRTLGRAAARLALARSATGEPQTDSSRGQIPAGVRERRWLVLSPLTSPVAADQRAGVQRCVALARALARRGERVTFAARPSRLPGPEPRGFLPAEVEVVDRGLPTLRAWLRGRDERLRILVVAPDSEAFALCREARASGGRVLYDKGESWAGRGDTAWYEPETERALIEVADDLVATTRALGAQLAAGGRPVHLLPDAGDWEARAASLIEISEVPTITVIVVCGPAGASIATCVDSLVAARTSPGCRVLVIDDGAPRSSLEPLAAREREGELAILGNPRRGASAARNLGLRASGGEMVVFLDSDQRALGPGWLDPAFEILLRRREIGAVARNAAPDLSYLGSSGLVVPRAVLAKTGGFDEAYASPLLAAADLSFRIRRAGYALAHCPGLGMARDPWEPRPPALGAEFEERDRRRLIETWGAEAARVVALS